jgi:cell division protein FtsL
MSLQTKSFTRSRTLHSQRVNVRKPKGYAGGAGIVPALLVVCLLIGMSLFYVWSRIETLKINYTVSQSQEQITLQMNHRQELKGMVAQLKNPERIAEIAEKKLGMTFPIPSQVWPVGEKADQGSLKVARP